MMNKEIPLPSPKEMTYIYVYGNMECNRGCKGNKGLKSMELCK